MFGAGFNETRRGNERHSMAASKKQEQTYSFPMLKSSEILQCMGELQIPITETEIMAPEKNKHEIRRALQHLVELCTGITREEMSQPAFSGLSALNYPELHEDSIPELAFLRACTKMMTICGIPDFGIKDIVQPNSKRLRRQLSGIINFAKFREERLQMYGELNAHREEILDSVKALQDENDQLANQHEQLKQQTASEKQIIESFESECRDIETQIGTLNKEQAAIRHESGELKKKANELKDKNATIALSIQESQADDKKYSSQIVQSPERVKKNMADAADRLEMEKKDAAQAEKDAIEVKVKIANFTKANAAISTVVKNLEETEVELNKQKQTKDEIKQVEVNINNNKENEQKCEEGVADSNRVVEKFENKVDYLRTQSKTKTAAAQEQLDATQTELLAVEKDRREGNAKIEYSEAQKRKVEAQIDEDANAAEKEIMQMVEQYKKMEEVVLSNQSNLMSAIAC